MNDNSGKNNLFWESFPWQKSDHQAKWLFAKANEEQGLFVLKLEPHAQVEMHSHPWPHHGMVLQGEINIMFKDRQETYKAGEVYCIASGEEHGGRPGPEGCSFIELRKVNLR